MYDVIASVAKLLKASEAFPNLMAHAFATRNPRFFFMACVGTSHSHSQCVFCCTLRGALQLAANSKYKSPTIRSTFASRGCSPRLSLVAWLVRQINSAQRHLCTCALVYRADGADQQRPSDVGLALGLHMGRSIDSTQFS